MRIELNILYQSYTKYKINAIKQSKNCNFKEEMDNNIYIMTESIERFIRKIKVKMRREGKRNLCRGCDSGWRTVNTESLQKAFAKQNGYFHDGECDVGSFSRN